LEGGPGSTAKTNRLPLPRSPGDTDQDHRGGTDKESFIENVLAPILWPREIYVTPILLGIPGHKGGNVSYTRVKRDILLHLRQDPTAYCSTMLDLDGLGGGFPGVQLPANQNGLRKAQSIEQAIYEDILATVPECRPERRFYAYLQVHEFEGLLFSDPDAFARALGQHAIAGALHTIRNLFQTPEDINDDPASAPSKRVMGIYRSYRKVIEGTVAAEEVGVQTMRQQCPHFHEWVSRLENATPLD
jgi:hypothetical protein